MKKLFVSAALMAVIALAGNADAAIKHPSLLFTPERVEAAAKRIKTDSVQASAWQQIKTTADDLLNKNDVRKMEYLALAYQLTGEKQYASKLREMLLAISEIPTWEDKEMMQREPAWRSELQMAHKAFQIAVAYDAIYNTLSSSDRKKIAKGVWRLAGEPLTGDWMNEEKRIHSLNSMGHNWWSSCVGMGGLLALAVSNEVEDAAKAAEQCVEALPEWFDFAGDEIQRKAKSFDDAGGMYESINYASFGITEALLLRMAWLNSHPGATLEDIPQMEKLADFFSHVAYPRDGILYSINFGDSHKNVTGESSMLLAYAMGEKDPATLWYVNQVTPGQHREGFPRHFPMGFLYTPDLSAAPATPDMPFSQIWKDFGWATMRDSWEKNASMLAVKSGMTWNHAHADANSFILFHNGHDIIKDAGNCSYGKPEYRNYFFQTDAHNVVKFNGKGQPRRQQYQGSMLPGILSGLVDAGSIKYVLANGTGPMSSELLRNYRHFLWIDDVIYIIDDLEAENAGTFQWLWHPGGEVKKSGGDLVVTKENSSAVIRPIFPQPLAPSNYVHDYPEMLYWEVIDAPEESGGTEQYYALHLPQETNKVKALNAIILKDSPESKDMPVITRREGKNWIGVRMEKGDSITDIYINQLADGRLMHMNSWIDADGWTTDAYLFAVTYTKNDKPSNPKRLFIGYGSSLKRDGDIYFNSLSKLNVAATSEKGNTMDITAEGQPRMRFAIRPLSGVKSYRLNGKPSNVRPDKKHLLRMNN